MSDSAYILIKCRKDQVRGIRNDLHARTPDVADFVLHENRAPVWLTSGKYRRLWDSLDTVFREGMTEIKTYVNPGKTARCTVCDSVVRGSTPVALVHALFDAEWTTARGMLYCKEHSPEEGEPVSVFSKQTQDLHCLVDSS